MKTEKEKDDKDSETETSTSITKINLQMDLTLNEHKYKRAMDKQDMLQQKTQEFCAIVNSLLRDNIKTCMEHAIYQEAYRDNDLLMMWEVMGGCAAGTTKSVQNRIQSKFY